MTPSPTKIPTPPLTQEQDTFAPAAHVEEPKTPSTRGFPSGPWRARTSNLGIKRAGV
jgi:hypothetical protein